MPRSFPTPVAPRQPHHFGCSVLASGSPKPSPATSLTLTGLYQALETAVSLTAYLIPCVRFNRFVRLLTSPPDGCNTRYEWLVSPSRLRLSLNQRYPAFLGARVNVYSLEPRDFFLAPRSEMFMDRHYFGLCHHRHSRRGV